MEHADYVKKLKAVLGKNIAHERQKQGLTIEALAELCYMTYENLKRIESGRGFPSIPAIFMISNALHVSLDRLGEGGLEWNELDELRKLDERYQSCTPQQLKKFNQLLDIMDE